MDLSIDHSHISKSFDRIAINLLTRKALFVNDKEFRFTEIEFYYFHKDFHPDNTVHEHKRDAGEWRFHNQGLDITFQWNDKQDGGILIRGVKVDNEYFSGPRIVIRKIFESFGKVTSNNTLVIKDIEKDPVKIVKTFRHLPIIENPPPYYSNYYRYFISEGFNNLKSASIKEKILQNSIIL